MYVKEHWYICVVYTKLQVDILQNGCFFLHFEGRKCLHFIPFPGISVLSRFSNLVRFEPFRRVRAAHIDGAVACTVSVRCHLSRHSHDRLFSRETVS